MKVLEIINKITNNYLKIYNSKTMKYHFHKNKQMFNYWKVKNVTIKTFKIKLIKLL